MKPDLMILKRQANYLNLPFQYIFYVQPFREIKPQIEIKRLPKQDTKIPLN